MYNDPNEVSGGEYLSDWMECLSEDNDGERSEYTPAGECNPEQLKEKQQSNRAAKVGMDIICACGCGNRFKKRSYQHVFYRNKGRSNCKDRFYNKIVPERLERTIRWNSNIAV